MGLNKIKQVKGTRLKGLVEAAKISLSDRLNFSRKTIGENRVYYQAAMEWIARAQDAHQGGGVAAFYNVLTGKWAAPYPETTGYIIPTLLSYAKVTGNQKYQDRALAMADWEIAVQIENGAVQSGNMDCGNREPAVFDTGQVLLGFTRAFEVSGREKYLQAARKGADWLVQVQDEDGAWKVGLSGLTNNPVHTYNTRAAWGLLQVYEITKDETYRKAAIKNIDWALTQQLDNGWFRNTAFNIDEDPLLHTICYVIEGILECGIQLNNTVYVKAAQKSAEALLKLQCKEGSLYGKYDAGWRPTVRWSCLTGNAQLSIIWMKIYDAGGDNRYLNAAQRMNDYLKRTQDLNSNNPGIRGGIKGSQPLWGGYGAFTYQNWATKFYIDALMLEESLTEKSDR